MRIEFTDPAVLPFRRCGNTTRMVDYMIQELFMKGSVVVRDHYYQDGLRNDPWMVQRNLETMLSRLQHEHGLGLKKGLSYDKEIRVLTYTDFKK